MTTLERIAAQLNEKGKSRLDMELQPHILSLAWYAYDNSRTGLGFELFCLEEQRGALRALYAATFPEAEETFMNYQEVREGSCLLQEWREKFFLRHCLGMPAPPIPAYTPLVDFSSHDISSDRAMDAAHAFNIIFNDKMQAQAVSGRTEYPPAL